MARRLASSASVLRPARTRADASTARLLPSCGRSPASRWSSSRLAPGPDRLVEAVHEHPFVRIGVEEPGPLGGRRGGGEAEGAGVLVRGLPMGPQRGGPRRGGGRVGQDGGGIAGALRMIGEPGQVGRARRG